MAGTDLWLVRSFFVGAIASALLAYAPETLSDDLVALLRISLRIHCIGEPAVLLSAGCWRTLFRLRFAGCRRRYGPPNWLSDAGSSREPLVRLNGGGVESRQRLPGFYAIEALAG